MFRNRTIKPFEISLFIIFRKYLFRPVVLLLSLSLKILLPRNKKRGCYQNKYCQNRELFHKMAAGTMI